MSGTTSGSVAAEAARLLEALEDLQRRWHQRTPAGPGAAPECSACPVCQLLAVVRGTRPEVVEHLLDAAGSLVAALRAATGPAGAPGGAAPPDPPRRPPAQPIDIS